MKNWRLFVECRTFRVCLIVASVLYAWSQRFVQDDAFISFRYAWNCAKGNGLVWNAGERVEGYSNFLWTLLMVPSFRLGIDVVTWSYIFSLGAFAIVLWASGRLADIWWRNSQAGTLSIVLLAGNYSFLCYGTGGLETQFGIMWGLLSVLALQKDYVLMAVLASVCALFTRLDACVLLLPFWLVATFKLWQRKEFVRIISAFVLGVLPLGIWFLWRHSYYGAWVPNTALIKSGSGVLLRGCIYLGLFYVVSGILICLPLIWGQAWKVLRAGGDWLTVFAAWGLWQLYMIWVGGDFMEFRMLLPALPLLIVFFGGVIFLFDGRQSWRRFAVPCILLICGTGIGWAKLPYPFMDTFTELREMQNDWTFLSQELVPLFGEERQSIKIGVTGAGIIPFYSQMPAYDLLGLNDRDVAMTGEVIPNNGRFGNRPGHVKMATWPMILSKDVTLLVNHPWVISKDNILLGCSAKRLARMWWGITPLKEFSCTYAAPYIPIEPEAPPVIAWPLSDGRVWLMVYVKQNDVVDAAIARCNARVIR